MMTHATIELTIFYFGFKNNYYDCYGKHDKNPNFRNST